MRELRVKRSEKLMERALLWLHEQEVIQLNKGLTVFRPAMTIRLQFGTTWFCEGSDFQPLRTPLRRTDSANSRH